MENEPLKTLSYATPPRASKIDLFLLYAKGGFGLIFAMIAMIFCGAAVIDVVRYARDLHDPTSSDLLYDALGVVFTLLAGAFAYVWMRPAVKALFYSRSGQ